MQLILILYLSVQKASFCVDVFYFKHPRHSQLFGIRFFEVSWTQHCSRNNIPDHLIKTLGWWSSDCYTRYIHTDEDRIIHTDEDSIRNAQIKIMQLWLLACMTHSYNALDYANFMSDRFHYIVQQCVIYVCLKLSKLKFWPCWTIDVLSIFYS